MKSLTEIKREARIINTLHTKTTTNKPSHKKKNCRDYKENYDWKEDYITISLNLILKTFKAEPEKINKSLTQIMTKNTMEIKEVIFIEAKMICDKIAVTIRTRTNIQNLVGKLDKKHRWEIYDNKQIFLEVLFIFTFYFFDSH